mmetsp:Transcript_9283/g.18820  ORF Transcript_9283/g.18820 Transcript_9283/m.18820 type:complete len:572 (-) Transcript_9283:2058-3773(-)
MALCPESEEYRTYYVQSSVKAGSWLDATRVSSSVQSQRMRLLQAQAELEQGSLQSCRTTLLQCLEDDPETIIAMATIDFKEGHFAKASEKYKIAKQVMGSHPSLTYYIALCHYRMGENDEALEMVDSIIQYHIRTKKNELRDINVHDHGDSFAVEAFNLKAAICYGMKMHDSAKDVLREICELQNNENLDNITIHNDVVVNIEDDPALGIERLKFLLAQDSFPPEVLGNLITQYLSHGKDDLASETLEANKQLAREIISPELLSYLEAAILTSTYPDEAIPLLEKIASKHVPKLKEQMNKITDAVTVSSQEKESSMILSATKEYDALLDQYTPILMLQAKIFWDKKEYSAAEQILEKSAELCKYHEKWRLNMGHVMFAQEGEKIKESIPYYELIIEKDKDTALLDVPSVALANLCVAFIMENQSKTASAIMERVKKEEERQMKFGEHESTYHSCIINLVIGTLYCAKENFEVGIDRIIESLKPIEKNLCSDTWFYTKRCFLALAAKLSKLMCVINDNTLRDILNILKNLIMKKNHFSHFETSFFTPSRFLHQSSNNIRKPDHAFHRLFHLA